MAVDCTRKENNVVHFRREVLGPFNRVLANIVSSKSSGLFRFQTTSELVFSPATHKDTTATKRERMLEVKKGRVENAASRNFLERQGVAGIYLGGAFPCGLGAGGVAGLAAVPAGRVPVGLDADGAAGIPAWALYRSTMGLVMSTD